MGDLIALLGAFFFAVANVTITRGAARGARDNGAFLSILMTALVSGLAMALFTPEGGRYAPSLAGLLWFAASGLLTIFVGRVFLYASVQHLGAVRASAVKRLNPVFSVLLGVLLLGEPVGGSMAAGMTLIFASFGLLAGQAWHARGAQPAAADGAAAHHGLNLGFVYGPVSALAYATGYLARKQGLIAFPDPNFGTLIGALAGAASFMAAAAFLRSYRAAVQSTFSTFNAWLYAAGLMSSLGQVLSFVALNHSTVSRVALVMSLEVIFTMGLSVVVLRRREPLGPMTIAAALMSVIGAALVIRQQ